MEEKELTDPELDRKFWTVENSISGVHRHLITDALFGSIDQGYRKNFYESPIPKKTPALLDYHFTHTEVFQTRCDAFFKDLANVFLKFETIDKSLNITGRLAYIERYRKVKKLLPLFPPCTTLFDDILAHFDKCQELCLEVRSCLLVIWITTCTIPIPYVLD